MSIVEAGIPAPLGRGVVKTTLNPNPTTEAINLALRLLRDEKPLALTARLVLLREIRKQASAIANVSGPVFRMVRAVNFIDLGVPKLAVEVLVKNDEWRL